MSLRRIISLPASAEGDTEAQSKRATLGLGNKTGAISHILFGLKPLGYKDVSQSTHHPPQHLHTQAETPEPAAPLQSIQEPQAAARDLALRKLSSAQMGTWSHMQFKKKKHPGGDIKIILRTFQLPEQQSPEKPALWESLSSLFLGIINRITAASTALNAEEGGKGHLMGSV